MEHGERLEVVDRDEEKRIDSEANQELESTGLGGRTSKPLPTSQG